MLLLKLQLDTNIIYTVLGVDSLTRDVTTSEVQIITFLDSFAC